MDNSDRIEEENVSVLSTIRFSYLILFILSILCSFFVFRDVSTVGGMRTGLFGGSHYVSPSRQVYNAFDLPGIFIEHGLLVLNALLMSLSVKRIWHILGIVVVSLAALFMVLMYAVLDLDLNLFGPPKIVRVGIGYYLLLLVFIGFFITTIYAFRKLRKNTVAKIQSDDLLDDPF